MPRAFNPNMRYIFSRRYQCSAGVTGQLAITDLINSLLFAATTTTLYSPFYAIQLKRISMWAPVTTIGTPVSLWLQPTAVETTVNCFGDLPEQIQDTAMSVDNPAYINYVPLERHPSGSWHITSATSINLLSFSVPIGTVMDLHLEGMINLTKSTQGYTATVAGATVGNVYTRSISNFVVVSVNSI